jgi:hypothetical protein
MNGAQFLLAPFMALMLLLVPASAFAETALVLQTESPAPNSWRKMNPNSFSDSIAAAVVQCERDARHSTVDRLTSSHCATFKRKLEAGQCDVGARVADGQPYTFMNGPGRVYLGMTKRTGRIDVTTRCDVGDDITIDWFKGEKGISCNNIGVIIQPKMTPIALAPAPAKPNCRYVTTTKQSSPSGGLLLSSVNSCCCIGFTPPLWIPPSGNLDNTVQTTLVCDGQN